jgi:anti-sigma regulatory factor (Ser/Thr protein kinase)
MKFTAAMKFTATKSFSHPATTETASHPATVEATEAAAMKAPATKAASVEAATAEAAAVAAAHAATTAVATATTATAATRQRHRWRSQANGRNCQQRDNRFTQHHHSPSETLAPNHNTRCRWRSFWKIATGFDESITQLSESESE